MCTRGTFEFDLKLTRLRLVGSNHSKAPCAHNPYRRTQTCESFVYCVVWFYSLRVQDRTKLERTFKAAKKIISRDVECLADKVDEHILTHFQKLVEDSSHLLLTL